MTENLALANPQHQVFSRLIDSIIARKERISWIRQCQKEGRTYCGGDIPNLPDNSFGATTYFSKLFLGDVLLNYHVDWIEKWTTFHLGFQKYAPLDLHPFPEDITLFSVNPYFEKERLDIPIYQARYRVIIPSNFDEAEIARQDFIKRGANLVSYFQGMQPETIENYLGLVKRFRDSKDETRVVRL